MKTIKAILFILIFGSILGCILWAASILALKFIYVVFAIGYIIHLIGVFCIAFLFAGIIYFFIHKRN